MYQKTYKIKKWFLIAFSAVVILLFLLSMLFIFGKGSFVEILVLISIFTAVLLIFIEAMSRKVLTGDQGILIRKFFREKKLDWIDITQVGMVVIRKRVYVLLTTTKGFHILTNAYEEFTSLLREIVGHVEKEKVDEEVRSRIEHPINKTSDIASMCYAAAVIAIIIALKIMTF